MFGFTSRTDWLAIGRDGGDVGQFVSSYLDWRRVRRDVLLPGCCSSGCSLRAEAVAPPSLQWQIFLFSPVVFAKIKRCESCSVSNKTGSLSPRELSNDGTIKEEVQRERLHFVEVWPQIERHSKILFIFAFWNWPDLLIFPRWIISLCSEKVTFIWCLHHLSSFSQSAGSVTSSPVLIRLNCIAAALIGPDVFWHVTPSFQMLRVIGVKSQEFCRMALQQWRREKL